jgi:FixJ family two-component response regulator
MSGTVAAPVVYIVEADESVRQGLARVVDSAGLESTPCASIDAFLSEKPAREAACALIDVAGLRDCRAPAWSRLRAMAAAMPVIALSARDDPATRRLARDLGAAAFFRMPVDAAALLDSIEWVTHADGARVAG